MELSQQSQGKIKADIHDFDRRLESVFKRLEKELTFFSGNSPIIPSMHHQELESFKSQSLSDPFLSINSDEHIFTCSLVAERFHQINPCDQEYTRPSL